MTPFLQNAAVFLVGFYILIKGAQILVKGATAVAQKLRLSRWLIGLLIVGIGTSIPEFAITLFAALRDRAPIGLGTIIGSNTFNILLILGLAAVIFPMRMKETWVKRDLPWNIIAVSAAIIAATTTSVLEPTGFSGLGRFDGFILVALFLWWVYIALQDDKQEISDGSPEDDIRIIALPLAGLIILGGILGVFVGGGWVVRSASALAQMFGMSPALIGLTIVGIGTSLPEFAVTIVAARQRQVGIAVGNIIGSNIFDFLFILGLAAFLNPLPFHPTLYFDIIVTLLSAIILYAAVSMGEKYALKRWQGLTFVVLYIAYIYILIIRTIVT